jgi:flagellar basal body-associated protein FliL
MKDLDLSSPKSISGEKATELKDSTKRKVDITIIFIAVFLVLLLIFLVGVIVLQFTQNTKIDKTLATINRIAVANNQITTATKNATEEANNRGKVFSKAVVILDKEHNNLIATNNEILYRIRQIEMKDFGYLPIVPDSIIIFGQEPKDLNGKDILVHIAGLP